MTDHHHQHDTATAGSPSTVATPGRRPARWEPSTAALTAVATVVDVRFPSGRAQILAWNVVAQGSHDLSTFLCRCANGDYVLHCRPATRPTMAAAIVPLSRPRALTWFDAHPVHFVDRDVLR